MLRVVEAMAQRERALEDTAKAVKTKEREAYVELCCRFGAAFETNLYPMQSPAGQQSRRARGTCALFSVFCFFRLLLDSKANQPIFWSMQSRLQAETLSQTDRQRQLSELAAYQRELKATRAKADALESSNALASKEVSALRELVRNKDADILRLQEEMAAKRMQVTNESETLRQRVTELEVRYIASPVEY